MVSADLTRFIQLSYAVAFALPCALLFATWLRHRAANKSLAYFRGSHANER